MRMDPNAAWRDLSQAIADNEWQRAADIAAELMEWLDRDGFPPSITGRASFDRIVVRSTCTAIVAWEVV
jgi:hypothetical protein